MGVSMHDANLVLKQRHQNYRPAPPHYHHCCFGGVVRGFAKGVGKRVSLICSEYNSEQIGTKSKQIGALQIGTNRKTKAKSENNQTKLRLRLGQCTGTISGIPCWELPSGFMRSWCWDPNFGDKRLRRVFSTGKKNIGLYQKRLAGNFGPEQKYLAPPPRHPPRPLGPLPLFWETPPPLLRFSIEIRPPLPAPRSLGLPLPLSP